MHEVEWGGSKEGLTCSECGGVTRCYHYEDTLNNKGWYCWGCLKWIYGVKK